MPVNRKLNLPGDQRRALLRNQVTHLLWHGKIETTLAKAKEVRSIAERMITLAVREYKNTVTQEKQVMNDKGEKELRQVQNDMPGKLAARRAMMAYLYDLQELQKKDESRSDYKGRTDAVKHPLIEKLFRELAPKYDVRAEEKGQKGGYTRIIKKGPRRGDAVEMVILELV